METRNFSEILEEALIEWRKQQTILRKSVSLNQFARDLGVSRPIVSLWLNGDRLPNRESLEEIAPILSQLIGQTVYDDLGLRRPDPLLGYISRSWDYLSPEQQNEIIATIREYLHQPGGSHETALET